MSNPSKAKGTRGESAVARWFRENGFPHADRQPLRGNRDAGDIDLCPGAVVVEVKSVKSGAKGAPPPGDLATWMAQAAAERDNAGAAYCPLIVKRAGTTDVGRWFAYLPLLDVWALLTGAHVMGADPQWSARHEPAHMSDPVCMSVHTLALILRAAGYGDPITEETP